MRKTFSLAEPGKHTDRLLDAIRHDIHKYLRRERRRDLPEGMDYWDFDCRVGPDAASAQPAHVSSLIGHVDEAARAGAPQLYVEIIARAARRQARSPRDAANAGSGASPGDVLRESLESGEGDGPH